MNFSDAAHLLIGVNATSAMQDAAKIVSVYRELEAYKIISILDRDMDEKYGTLCEAIEQLLAALAACELPEIFLNADVADQLRTAFSQGEFYVALRFSRPDPSALLEITTLPKEAATSEEATEALLKTFGDVGLSFSFRGPRRRGRSKRPGNKADRTEETMITHRTLGAVAKLLSNER
jgi:hypothetical protein